MAEWFVARVVDMAHSLWSTVIVSWVVEFSRSMLTSKRRTSRVRLVRTVNHRIAHRQVQVIVGLAFMSRLHDQ